MFKILIAEDDNELCHLFQKVLELGEDVPVMTTQLGCAYRDFSC